ncbi:acetyltransferase [Larsenimonas rhizosphaerae]|uniref:acetyltransferase n=1 Tax=Larsenimonas rhizosphaerae TaxID=2944682 RepID=UPI002033A7BF|nr:acetyltransferase [Larsenimonas rhizosphaerae]MCM2131850.1 acetyltransferase [Larsenimonas rhizosphaerae]
MKKNFLEEQGYSGHKVIVFGTGQIAEIARFYLDNFSDNDVIGYTVNREFIRESFKDNLPVIPWENIELNYSTEDYRLFCPVSFKNVNKNRKRVYLEGKEKGYGFVSFIHPDARYYNTFVGENCFIFEDNVIQPYTRIGDNCILWSGNHIGHHSIIGDHCFVASHVVISGAVNIGESCFFGVNSTVVDNVNIGESCVIGAAALVTKSLPANSMVAAPKSRYFDEYKGKLGGD